MVEQAGLDDLGALEEAFYDLIEAHNHGHAISNSPYGHVCGKRCWARTLAARASDIVAETLARNSGDGRRL